MMSERPIMAGGKQVTIHELAESMHALPPRDRDEVFAAIGAFAGIQVAVADQIAEYFGADPFTIHPEEHQEDTPEESPTVDEILAEPRFINFETFQALSENSQERSEMRRKMQVVQVWNGLWRHLWLNHRSAISSNTPEVSIHPREGSRIDIHYIQNMSLEEILQAEQLGEPARHTLMRTRIMVTIDAEKERLARIEAAQNPTLTFDEFAARAHGFQNSKYLTQHTGTHVVSNPDAHIYKAWQIACTLSGSDCVDLNVIAGMTDNEILALPNSSPVTLAIVRSLFSVD